MVPTTITPVLRHIAFGVTRTILGATILIISSALAVVVYRLTLHPLARVPGPKVAAVSNIWLAWHAKHGRMGRLGKTLHKRYGHVVRVGVDEVWVDAKDGFSSIYGGLCHGLNRYIYTLSMFVN